MEQWENIFIEAKKLVVTVLHKKNGSCAKNCWYQGNWVRVLDEPRKAS